MRFSTPVCDAGGLGTAKTLNAQGSMLNAQSDCVFGHAMITQNGRERLHGSDLMMG
jgi:hypothetical protein